VPGRARPFARRWMLVGAGGGPGLVYEEVCETGASYVRRGFWVARVRAGAIAGAAEGGSVVQSLNCVRFGQAGIAGDCRER
jgi:hypothetical protein